MKFDVATINTVCERFVGENEDVIAAAVISLIDGAYIAGKVDSPGFDESLLDFVSAATAGLFRGKMVGRISRLLSERKGKSVKGPLRDIYIGAAGAHLFMSILENHKAVAVLVSQPDLPMGMGWVHLKQLKSELPQGKAP